MNTYKSDNIEIIINNSIVDVNFSNNCDLLLKSTYTKYGFKNQSNLSIDTKKIAIGRYYIYVNNVALDISIIVTCPFYDTTRRKVIIKQNETVNLKNTKVSVVIPTYNAGVHFVKVLKAITEQIINPEIIIVDSGSTDTTIETVNEIKKTYNNIKLYSIPKNEFQHGKTRNYGVSLSTGKYIALTTQDSLPYDKMWLYNLIEPMLSDNSVAGTFGAHLPYEDTNLVEKLRMLNKFRNIGKQAKIAHFPDYHTFEKLSDQKKAYMLEFYSNSSAFNRKVWEKYPYPEVMWAEDRAWVSLILKKGFKKVYAENSIIYHSHNHSYCQYYKRWYESTYFHFFSKPLLDDYITKSWLRGRLSVFIHIKQSYRYLRKIKINRFNKILIFVDDIIRVYIKYFANLSAYRTFKRCKK